MIAIHDRPFGFARIMILAASFVLTFLTLSTRAYIPAQPTNDSTTVQASFNQSDGSMLYLQWYPNGTYSEHVSYQLVGAFSTGINIGPIVHFSEANLTNDTTTTPWIALVSCDVNSTNASMSDDIFTLAQARGAIAALLYSEWSTACIINPAYADPAFFNQIMDIFATTSLSTSQLVSNAFVAVNQSLYSNFSAQMLNDSAAIVNETLATNSVPSPSYLFATLLAGNATFPNGNMNDTGNTTTSASGGGSGKNTDLAMIVLYVITGAVSVLFCIVILSGAIRAIRHPERYGPRAGDPTIDGPDAQGQSRARGLTRAIVETFPVIKFSRAAGAPGGQEAHREARSIDKPLDSESDPSLNDDDIQAALEMVTIEPRHNSSLDTDRNATLMVEVSNHDIATSAENDSHDTQRISVISQGRLTPLQAGDRDFSDSGHLAVSGARHSQRNSDLSLVPDAIGRDTCPICIVDFEEGDDLRILPCEGQHVFHQQCVDPWLLELSSSCPICRHDFQTLATMMTGGSSEHHNGSDSHERFSGTPSMYGATRLSRYLRFAQMRRNRNRAVRDSILEDPTDPPAPLAPESHL